MHRDHDDDAESGRGLELVRALSDRWSCCIPVAGGKVIWAQFALVNS